jgi:hypothetical protein
MSDNTHHCCRPCNSIHLLELVVNIISSLEQTSVMTIINNDNNNNNNNNIIIGATGIITKGLEMYL